MSRIAKRALEETWVQLNRGKPLKVPKISHPLSENIVEIIQIKYKIIPAENKDVHFE